MTDRGKPLYMIGVVAEMLKVHPQTLRFYEKKGLLRPSRTVGRTRMYSAEDVEDLARLLRLTRDLGVNLAGVEIILKMRRRMVDMQKQIEDLLAYVRETGGDAGTSRARVPGGAGASRLGPAPARSISSEKGEAETMTSTRTSEGHQRVSRHSRRSLPLRGKRPVSPRGAAAGRRTRRRRSA